MPTTCSSANAASPRFLGVCAMVAEHRIDSGCPERRRRRRYSQTGWYPSTPPVVTTGFLSFLSLTEKAIVVVHDLWGSALWTRRTHTEKADIDACNASIKKLLNVYDANCIIMCVH